MGVNLDAVRAAVEQARVVAGEFHTGIANFYRDGDTTPVFANIPCRIKKPKTSSFDAGNQTEWSTKRETIIKIDRDAVPGIIPKGLIVQVATEDGDPTINHINFVVLSALSSQFSAERSISVTTEIIETPRVNP